MRRSASVIVEVLAVLFIVGLLAVVAIPDYDQQQPGVRQRSLIVALEQVRTALDRYWAGHEAAYPAFEELESLRDPRPTAALRTGLGAHLRRVPNNPYTNGNSIGPIDAPVGSSDWVYDHATGVFKANNSIDHRAL